jgi:hypothetical protein
MFDELNSSFPDHTHFYEVIGLSLTDAMESCARLAAGDPQIFNYNGKIIFAVQNNVSVTDIPWLTEVPGSPTVVEETVVDPTTPSE